MTGGKNEDSAVTGYIDGAAKDRQSITSDWVPVQDQIDGVQLREIKNVLGEGAGMLTEVFRRDWKLDDGVVDQVFQSVFEAGQISGWHLHQHTIDRLFVSAGHLKIVLHDSRSGSRSSGMTNTFTFGERRPALLVIPPGVWHAVKNIGKNDAILLNLVDRAYSYADPDHWRLPIDTDKIPYPF